ncbi:MULTISPECIES: hypothetical protein [Pseudomonas]|uniref:Uncharacterized protein n=1 Tax=Pseudomonas nitroreducens TaxID=46680 RepID=A0A246F2P5_PSENT|nr:MULTISPECIES: hypothetical protein [Pseudomonas]MCG8911416.1 hypothetical protein [Pseudomonas sp. DP-17]MDU4253854.1 hypothetical protein [Pseudomonas sp.]OWP36671.1 hypothetical protein CEG18_29800 [Pseudomonas nitroreducens]OWP47499.1 hypothetical protein CEG18_28545 [Pseudomonas nitroreducens]
MTYDAALAKARWAELERQNDLDWDLDAITDRNEAIAFLQRFENRLCIYSSYVEKLYSNYSFVIPESQEGGITILPDEQAWFDTFHDIPGDAVEPTGIHILPGETMGYSGLYLKIPAEHRLVASRELPFQDGLKLLINRYRMRGDIFLPVLVKGDLREYEARMPSLHLHRLNIARLQAHSRLNLDAIKGAIAEHLIGLFRHQ